MLIAQSAVTQSLSQGLATVARLIPTIITFLLILVIGYFVAKLVSRAIAKVLDRVGFDKAVEKGGVKKALANSNYDPSDILGQVVFYAILLFVFQMAFGVFGQNPISELITGVIAFLPKVFVAILIIVVASAIGAALKEIIEASLGGLSYGRALAGAASGLVLAIGVFMALNQLQIAPAIVNGLFYAFLALVVGSGIVAIGGGGIQTMQQQWQRAAGRIEEEAPKVKQESQGSKEKIQQRAQERKQQASGQSSGGPSQGDGGQEPAGTGGQRPRGRSGETETRRLS